MDPATDEVFLYWILDRVKVLARDPKFLAEYEEWQAGRAAKAAASEREALRT